MGVIWKNTLEAFNQSDAEKVLAYAKEHYKEHGIEDYDEDTMDGLQFDEDCLIYTDVRIDKLNAFYNFVDEIAAAFPEAKLNLRQVGDGHMMTDFVNINGKWTKYEPRLLELLAADKADSIKLIETAVPIIEAAGFTANVDSEKYSVSFECDAKACAEFRDALTELVSRLMPDSKLLCLVHDLYEIEFTITEYCVLNGHKGDWANTNRAMYYLVDTIGSRFSIYDAILNPIKCFKELQEELRAGKESYAFTALQVLFEETPHQKQVVDLLTPEDQKWLTKEAGKRSSVQARVPLLLPAMGLPKEEAEELLDELRRSTDWIGFERKDVVRFIKNYTEYSYLKIINHYLNYEKGCLPWGIDLDSCNFDWTIEELRSMSQHLSFALVTKNPEDIKKVVEFAVELTKEEFEKHSLDYTEYLEVEEDYLDWYDCFSGMIDFDALMSRIASNFPEVEFVLCVFPSSDPSWTEFEWVDGKWIQRWSNSEFCASEDKASMELNKKASFWAQRCSEISQNEFGELFGDDMPSCLSDQDPEDKSEDDYLPF